MTIRRKLFVTAFTVVVVGGALAAPFVLGVKSHRPPALVYTKAGYGGYVSRSTVTSSKPSKSSENVPVASMWDAYNDGRYADAERVARDIAKSHRLG